MMNYFWFVLAACAEIGGCYGFWMWLRLDRSPLYALVGCASLVLFAWSLTRVEIEAAGRAYAAYGGIYILASLIWLALVEHVRPSRADLVGSALALIGASVIVLGQRWLKP